MQGPEQELFQETTGTHQYSERIRRGLKTSGRHPQEMRILGIKRQTQLLGIPVNEQRDQQHCGEAEPC